MPIIDPAMYRIMERELRAVLDRECLCTDKPFHPNREQYNPDCPCHEEFQS